MSAVDANKSTPAFLIDVENAVTVFVTPLPRKTASRKSANVIVRSICNRWVKQPTYPSYLTTCTDTPTVAVSGERTGIVDENGVPPTGNISLGIRNNSDASTIIDLINLGRP